MHVNDTYQHYIKITLSNTESAGLQKRFGRQHGSHTKESAAANSHMKFRNQHTQNLPQARPLIEMVWN